MGVTGLWRLIEPTGKPVPVETLENKVLAVDISIWLHQMVKGYQDAKGAPIANAHLMGLFQRLCKLLYFRIKPVFVFDGGFPDLKRETISKRQDHKAKYNSESERIKRELALLLSKKTAINSLLGKQISPKKNATQTHDDDSLFKLPQLPNQQQESESDSEDDSSSSSLVDLHSLDLDSDKFKNMPIKEKYDLLIELKETRKMNSWGKLHELPKKSDNFSDFQMQRLLKRRKVQECFEETEKEMGVTGMSLKDLESLLNEEGIDTNIESLPTRRIASKDNTRFLLINNVKQALADAKKRNTTKDEASSSVENKNVENEKPHVKDELESDLEKAIKMSMECVNETDTSTYTSKTDDSWTSCLTDTDYSDSEDEFEAPDMSTAKAYIMQYTDLTNSTIDKIVSKKPEMKNKPQTSKLSDILEEIKKEKSLIESKLEMLPKEDIQEIDEPSQINNIIISNKINYDKEFVKIVDTRALACEKNIEMRKEEFEIKTRQKESTGHHKMLVDNEIEEEIILTEDMNANGNDENITVDLNDPLTNKDNTSNKQQDAIYINSSVEDVICLDSSVENNDKKRYDIPGDSESSDDEFEDVPEIDSKPNTVVKLVLDANTTPDKDDIFADIFDNKGHLDLREKSREDEKETENVKHASVDQCSKVIINDVTIEEMRNDISGIVNTYTTNKNTPHLENEIDSIENYVNVEEDNLNRNIISQQKVKEPISSEKLNTMVDEIQAEENILMHEKGRLDRIGRNITEQMTKDTQELLQIFGIPYIVAPMEAEAQCAFLESINLTSGTITDDSDIWLFGGKTVYKNFFNKKKHVLQFLADRIEKSFNLSREQLVLLALLVGSDYTTGVTGVGPVTALEILASFPFKKNRLNETVSNSRYMEIVTGLQEFKKWVRAGKRTDNVSLKKKLKNVALTEDFPSVRVVQAYLDPNVEKSEEKLTWGELDITILREYTKNKFGWSQNKLDEIVKPVLKRLQDRKLQKTVEDYFKKNVKLECLEDQMSKRVKAAVQKMERNLLSTSIDSIPSTHTEDKPKKGKKRKKIELSKAGPSKPKQTKNLEDTILTNQCVKVVTQTTEGKTRFEIQIPKTDRLQEIIPQREKDRQNLLQNKMKAIEIFRKTKIDRKRKVFKKKAILPKNDAELSESDSE